MPDVTRNEPAVTVYIPCRNYGRFLRQAVSSVLAQTFDDWHLLIVDDASTDETPAVIAHLPGDPRIATYRNDQPRGLRAVANFSLQRAEGDFLLRLDADDWLHPRALELLTAEARAKPNVAMVFSDYFYADEQGHVTGVETLPRAENRYGPTSFPPHGACSLLAVATVRAFGGLDETLRRQDGHEVWLRMLSNHGCTAHVDIPLFYYRQHADSLSSRQSELLADRAAIKRTLVSQFARYQPVTGVINVCNTFPDLPDLPFAEVGARTLLERALQVALATETVDHWVLSTDCERTVDAVKRRTPSVVPLLRRPELRYHDADMREILEEVVTRLGLSAESSLVTIGPHSPFLTPQHVDEAVRTHHLYDVDSVVSVYEEQRLTYQMGIGGLRPMNPAMQYRLRREREAVYVDNAAIRVLKIRNLEHDQFLGRRVGHVLMSKRESLSVLSADDLAFVRAHVADRALV